MQQRFLSLTHPRSKAQPQEKKRLSRRFLSQIVIANSRKEFVAKGIRIGYFLAASGPCRPKVSCFLNSFSRDKTMKQLFPLAALLVQSLLCSNAARAENLDEIFAPAQSLCGKPDFKNSCLEEGLLTLNLDAGSVSIIFDLSTAQELSGSLNLYDVVCVPVADSSQVVPGQTLHADRFAAWSTAGSGISVSNQKTKKPADATR
jgi:hypothetical protein